MLDPNEAPEMYFDLKDYEVCSSNKAQCLECGSIIESKYVHDFVTCSCGKLSLDGGTDYQRVSFTDYSKIKFLSEVRYMSLQEVTERILRNEARIKSPYISDFSKTYYSEQLASDLAYREYLLAGKTEDNAASKAGTDEHET